MESEANMGSPWTFMARRQDQVEQASASTRSNMDGELNSTTLSLYLPAPIRRLTTVEVVIMIIRVCPLVITTTTTIP